MKKIMSLILVASLSLALAAPVYAGRGLGGGFHGGGSQGGFHHGFHHGGEPRGDDAARDERHEGAALHHWITSSARCSSDGGIVSPNALAVLSRVEDWRVTP